MDRLAREIEFHDQRFADGVGARPQDHFYVSIRGASDLTTEKVIECVRRGGSGLEIGCSTGWTIENLFKEGRFEAHGIDISSAAIHAAEERFADQPQKPTFSVMDANHLQYPDGSFDFVFGRGVIHHLELPQSLKESRRVLRPGGRFVFMEPLGTNPFIEWYRRRTPEDRSPDETPLTAEHLAQLREVFDKVSLTYFGFLSLAGVPLRRWPGLQKLVVGVGSAIDRLIFKLPGAWRLAWYVVIDAQVGGAGARKS